MAIVQIRMRKIISILFKPEAFLNIDIPAANDAIRINIGFIKAEYSLKK